MLLLAHSIYSYRMGSTSSQSYNPTAAVSGAEAGWADANLLRCFPALVVGSAARIAYGTSSAASKTPSPRRQRRREQEEEETKEGAAALPVSD